MRPIFTIHSGEYLVATRIEESFPELRIWIPSSDTGVDLLVTDSHQEKVASLQVKFSKDYLGTKQTSSLTAEIVSGGWWTLNRKKIAASEADFWVFVLYQFHTRRFDFLVIPPRELLARYNQLGVTADSIQSYFWVTKQGLCWETRGLKKDESRMVCIGKYANPKRDFTKYLNVWPFRVGGA